MLGGLLNFTSLPFESCQEARFIFFVLTKKTPGNNIFSYVSAFGITRLVSHFCRGLTSRFSPRLKDVAIREKLFNDPFVYL